MKKRSIRMIVVGLQARDGAGVNLQRVLGHKTKELFDPFLMLDSFDSTNPNDYINGFPWHPHRGIETITYLISGEMEHEDSLGNKGIIRPLESQWMNSGSGIMHQEMPLASDRMLGFQLWLNLPQKDKMSIPTYNDLKQENVIKVIEQDNSTVRLVSGEYQGQKAFQSEYVQATILDVELYPNKRFTYEVNEDETLFVFTLENSIKINDELISEKKAILMENGDSIEINSLDKTARFAIIHALPLKEPIAWWGSIVMNTTEELQLAYSELRENTFIKESAKNDY